MSGEIMYRHDLLLSSDEQFALASVLASTLMAFYNTRNATGLTGTEWKEYKATKKLYETLIGAPADRLLKTYQRIMDNPLPIDDECPF